MGQGAANFFVIQPRPSPVTIANREFKITAGESMKIKAVEFSEAFLHTLADLSEDARESALSSLELEMPEPSVDPAAIPACDPRIVGRLILDDENGATAFLTLKGDSD